MISRKELIKEYERIKNEECSKNFSCINNDSGICMWQKHSGCRCNSNCERYKKCFTCRKLGICEQEIETMLCENLEKGVDKD